jgi:hypothetical protein
VGLSRKEKGNFGVSPKLKASSILMLQIVLWVVYYKCLWYEVLFVGRIRRVFFESTHTTQDNEMKWKCFEREHTRKIKKGMGFYLKGFGVCGVGVGGVKIDRQTQVDKGTWIYLIWVYNHDNYYYNYS